MARPLLEMRGVKKRFGALEALRGVDLELYPGDVLALLGDNGAGKSTLMKILAGAIAPDEGEIFFKGAPVTYHTPGGARALGIEMVYQDLALCDSLDAAHNLYLGREPIRTLVGAPFVDRRRMYREARLARGSEAQRAGDRLPRWDPTARYQARSQPVQADRATAARRLPDRLTVQLTLS